MLNCTAARASTFILKAKPIPPHEFYRVILFLVLTKYPLLFLIPLFTHAIKSRGSKYILFYRTTHRLQIGASGVIIGAMGFRNPYDGHTVEPALEQTERLLGKRTIKTLIGDRGYKGKRQINDTTIEIPKPFSDKKQSQYRQNKLKKQFRRRAAIEPINGHLKTDHRLNRNFYKGITGDNINVMLAAAAFNFKRMMNKWKSSFWLEFKIQIVDLINSMFYQINYKIILKWAF